MFPTDPEKWTGIIALVFVIFFFTLSKEICRLSSSMSQITGFAPAAEIACKDAIYVKLGTKTSSFNPTSADWSATCKAAVPELKQTTSLLKNRLSSFSNFWTSGPMPKNSLSKTFFTETFSSVDKQDLDNLIIFFFPCIV